MIVHNCAQYSPEWWQLRMGVPTASAFDRIQTPGGKPSAQAEGYIDDLIAETLCPTAPFFTERSGHTAAMRNGINMEPEARRFFELAHDGSVRQVGFITTNDKRFGCSPDFLTADDCPGELKCPEPSTHVGYYRKGVLPAQYRPQAHGHLIVTGAPVCYFMSYSPGTVPPLIVEVREDEYTAKLRAALDQFWEDYQDALFKIRQRTEAA